MIDGLKPYHRYKSTDVPWLVSIPETWQLRRTKRILRERSQKGLPNEPLLAATQTKGVVRKEEYESRTVLAMKDLHLLKLVKRGDFVISLRSFQGGIEFARDQGIISPAYTVLYPVEPQHHGYLALLFKSNRFIENLSLFVTGIRQGQNIDYERLGRAELPLPPNEDQDAIVHFLRHASRRIERIICTKMKLIALLYEQKQAIIHRAVTQGLDPAIRLKASGVPWIGEIPEHWDVWRISRFARVGNGSTPSRSNTAYWRGGTYPWLNSSHVHRRAIESADQFVTSEALLECHLPKVPMGSVLVAITGQGKTRGTAALLKIEATINQHIAYITPRSTLVHPEFLQLTLQGAYKTLRELSEDSGSTKAALTCEDLKRFKVAVPPMSEQLDLLGMVRSESRELDATIAHAEREVELMREYRSRIIADVVTGQLDVREAVRDILEDSEKPFADLDTSSDLSNDAELDSEPTGGEDDV